MSDKEKTNGSLAMAPRVITIPAANQETARKLRVAAYTRVSSNSKDQEHSFAAQNTQPGDNVIIQSPVYYPYYDYVRGTGRNMALNALVSREGY